MRKIHYYIGGCIFLLLVAIGMAGGLYCFVLHPNTTVDDDGIIYIRPENSFEEVVQLLYSKEYIKHAYTFRKVAEWKQYPKYLKPGRYKLRDGMNNNQLVNLLRSGEQEPVRFTFNNIRTLEDFAGELNRQLGMDSIAFLALARDSAFVGQYGFTTFNFIGMFIPNTYQVFWYTSPAAFIRRMYNEYRTFWNPSRLAKAKNTGLSPMDVLTIASIVEEETNVASEYPIIAGIYINRLRRGWRLEACPTLKFALGDFTIRRVLDKHKETDSPYNTYKYAGLPPGPVRIPSIRVVDAVLGYVHHNYMFFCAKSDFSGTHHFSRTLSEHNRHAAEYHRALNRQRIYK